jgi:hypothetical protein
MRMTALVVAVTLAAGCGKEKLAPQAAVEKGLEGIEQARALQQQSQKWKAPTSEEAERAIRALESGRGEIETLSVRAVTHQDQYDKYVARATLNGQDRTYELERNAAGVWLASAGATD